jgi:hypothetical protein
MSVNDASRIVIDDSRVALQIVASLKDVYRGVIYNCNMCIVQATAFTLVSEIGWPKRAPITLPAKTTTQLAVFTT